MIDVLAQDYPVTVACDVLGCVRSSYYHQASESPDEMALRGAIKAVAAKCPLSGGQFR